MTFQLLSFLLATLALGKATVALLGPNLFYRVRRRQYASARVPASVLIVPASVITMTALAWYVTVTNYAPWGWLLTGFLTLISLLATLNLLRWSHHRQLVHDAITHDVPTRTRVDLALLAIGALYLYLAIRVY